MRTFGAAVRQLRARVLRDPDSVALRSRLAWAKFLANALRWEDKGTAVAELDGLDWLALRSYEPWEELSAIDTAISEALRTRLEARQIEPGFEVGTYRDNRNSINLVNAAHVTPLSDLRYLAEQVGIPIRILHVDVLGTRLEKALRLAFEPTATWHSAFLSTEPSYSGGPIDVHLGRIPVARLKEEAVAELRKRLEHAITFWRTRVRSRNTHYEDVGVLRIYVEALSRVAARDDADTAKAHARLAVELGSDEGLRHWWLNEPIGHLLKRAVDAVPPDQRGELSSEFLRFPLAAERGARGPSMPWYDPGPDAYRFVCRSGIEAIFDVRVTAFIHHLGEGGASRTDAAVRLLHLHRSGQLTDDQASSFAAALWKDVPHESNALPMGLNLLSHAFLIAPAPPNIDARARVYANLFGPDAEAEPIHLVMAATNSTHFLQPSETDAVRLFDKLAGWRPAMPRSTSVGDIFGRQFHADGNRMTASILGTVAAPALVKHDRTVERAEAALTFLDETSLPEALHALPVFYGLSAGLDRRIENAFRRPLAIGDRRATPASVEALDHWLRLSETGQAPPLPDVLCDRVLRALQRGRTGGLSHLIYLARRLIEAGRFGNAEVGQVTEVLDELHESTNYDPPDGEADIESDRAVSLPLIRAECVRLAIALERKGVIAEPVRAWRNLAARDPLPEVRGAARDLTDE